MKENEWSLTSETKEEAKIISSKEFMNALFEKHHIKRFSIKRVAGETGDIFIFESGNTNDISIAKYEVEQTLKTVKKSQ